MADGRLRTFTDEQMRILSRVINRERTRPINTNKETVVDQVSQAPELYIARIPDDGIPGFTENTSPTDDEIFDEDCDIYMIERSGNNKFLSKNYLFTKPVYNISPSAIHTRYTVVTRTKYGFWIAVPAVVPLIPFELVNPITRAGTANAQRLEWDGTTYAKVPPTFSLSDAHLKLAHFGGVNADRGLYYHASDGARVLANISTRALWIEFTLASTGGDLVATNTQHLVTVTAFHGGNNPGNEVTVEFEEKWEANVGNVGKAIYGSDKLYHCLVIDCLT